MNYLDIQLRQLDHDRNFHQDILSLSTQDRIKHLVLHFSKYIAYLLDSDDDNVKLKIYTDIVICCLSFANVLNISLSKINMPQNIQRDEFVRTLSVSCGRMAKACEALDHLESYPFRETFIKELVNIFNGVLIQLEHYHKDILELLQARWKEIEIRNLFNANCYSNSVANSRKWTYL